MKKSKEKEVTLPFELANEFLTYNSETGDLIWKVRDRKHFPSDRSWKWWNVRFAGKVAGCINGIGYREIGVNGNNYLSHRLAWLLHYGAWPTNEIDHINNDPADNRIENLREATHFQNMRNRSSVKESTSKYLGVYWDKQHDKWKAQIRVDGTKYHLGYFTVEKDAARAYNEAAKKYHGEFANLNIIEDDE